MASAYLDRKPHTERVRKLNDTLRRSLLGGRVHITSGIAALPNPVQLEVLERIQQFEDFNEDNDPWSEHDFGALDVRGQRIFFKIDYYDHSLEAASPNPADPTLTERVLTIMLAEEY